MKKLFFIFLFSLLVAMILYYAHKDPGYVMISYQHWIIATSVWVAVATVLLAFFVIYFLLRTLHFFTSLPTVLRHRRKLKRVKKLQSWLSQGIICRLLGNHKKAEKYFVKAAAVSDDPASLFLLAAQSANVVNAADRREKYLQMALSAKPEYAAAVMQIRVK